MLARGRRHGGPISRLVVGTAHCDLERARSRDPHDPCPLMNPINFVRTILLLNFISDFSYPCHLIPPPASVDCGSPHLRSRGSVVGVVRRPDRPDFPFVSRFTYFMSAFPYLRCSIYISCPEYLSLATLVKYHPLPATRPLPFSSSESFPSRLAEVSGLRKSYPLPCASH